MIWRLNEQALDQLQPERQGFTDQLNVFVRLVDRRPIGQSIADLIDRIAAN
jgi:hypothetical protein